MWSRKPMPVSISHSPEPSRSRETAISVSRVFLSTVAVRILIPPPAFAGPRASYSHLPRQGYAHGGGAPGRAYRHVWLYSSEILPRESLLRERIWQNLQIPL